MSRRFDDTPFAHVLLSCILCAWWGMLRKSNVTDDEVTCSPGSLFGAGRYYGRLVKVYAAGSCGFFQEQPVQGATRRGAPAWAPGSSPGPGSCVGAARAIQRCVAYRTSVCLYGGRGGTPLPIWDPAVGAEITVSVHRGGTLCCVIPQPSARRGYVCLAQRCAGNTTTCPRGLTVYVLSGLHRCLPRGTPNRD